MKELYSLDLSFCTKLSAVAISHLLLARGDSLAELRLQSCRQLVFTLGPSHVLGQRRGRENEGGLAGRQILDALQSLGQEGCLSVLDIRNCGGQTGPNDFYPANDPFVHGLTCLEFEQNVPGFFSRSARWNLTIEHRLMEQFSSAQKST